MKSPFHTHITTCLVGLLYASTATIEAQDAPIQIEVIGADIIATAKKIKPTPENTQQTETKNEEPSSRVFLTNGDKLRGAPLNINQRGQLLFESDSLRQTAAFPLNNVVCLNLDGWQIKERPDTLARIKLHPRFRESTSDTLLGELHELTPDSIKLKTWYGDIITLKRAMVKSLKIINNSLGSYFGPNNIHEWSLPQGKGTWQFQKGSLVSRAKGGVGRDIGLREKAHISFDLKWSASMRFRMLLYSNDVTTDQAGAYYDLNFNRNYTFLRTHGKLSKKVQQRGGGRWQQIQLLNDTKAAHFDIFADRKAGTFSVYVDNVRVCLLQSLTPDPEDLGTGLSFIAEEQYPIQVSGITVTPWNGTSLPNQTQAAGAIKPAAADDKNDESKPPPHKILLNNGDEVPGTVGKVEDGHMIIETEYTPIQIPLKRIKSLNLGDTGEEPKKYADDIRAWFHQGGHITLKLSSFKDGKINGYSQAFGDIELDLSAFNRIDFHIYDKEINALREEIQ